MQLLAEERRSFILDQLHAHGKVRVTLLAEQLQVSQETVRRDLFLLEEEGKLKRVYGGGVKPQYEGGEPPYQQRTVMNFEAKQAIGMKAVELVQDGSTIYMDTGTTIYEMAKALKGKKEDYSHYKFLNRCHSVMRFVCQGSIKRPCDFAWRGNLSLSAVR